MKNTGLKLVWWFCAARQQQQGDGVAAQARRVPVSQEQGAAQETSQVHVAGNVMYLCSLQYSLLPATPCA